jgi:lysyl-tRNA synthetase class II
MINRLTGLFIAGLLCSLPAHSHHSPASHYDMDKSITVTGVVTKFRLINPHARIYFEVTTDNGEVQLWLAEGNASAILKRRGWRKDTLKVGDIIKISGNPAKDSSTKMDWKLIILEDGTELYGGNTVAEERERQLNELEKRRRSQIESE